MRILCARDIIGDRPQFLCAFQHLLFGDVNEFGILINKPADQPWTGDPVDLWPLSCYPFHMISDFYLKGKNPINAAAAFLFFSESLSPLLAKSILTPILPVTAFSKTIAAAATSCKAIPVLSKTVISSVDTRPGFLPATIS